ncbi:MAG: hypothetical protein ABIQ77_05365 [Anaerolineales bacterium]
MPKLFKSSTPYPYCQRFMTVRINGRVSRLPLWKTSKVGQPL